MKGKTAKFAVFFLQKFFYLTKGIIFITQLINNTL
ncbi:hypothetical protein B0I21_102462 [Sphingobacterium paludis]|uniref:Uncharacterized protein n=1 Tax=Sphingobacterium paludis TaxID=1476465 RepID=A0A4R7DAP1_9SPHI|nr:hypothetical protein B0I21_102462 [Sphingobacterium paludis]